MCLTTGTRPPPGWCAHKRLPHPDLWQSRRPSAGFQSLHPDSL